MRSKQDTLPGCEPAPPVTLMSLLAHPRIKVYTSSDLSALARNTAEDEHPDRIITSLRWTIATFGDQPPTLIATYRLSGDDRATPDHIATQPL